MLHIRPVLEKDASGNVKKAYEDIKKTLGIHFVPLLFQYIAGFEEYFLYSWEKIKTNLESNYYEKATGQIIAISRDSIATIYRQSRFLHTFLSQIQPSQKHEITKTVADLEFLNAKLLLLTIALREGVKGVVIGQSFLPKEEDFSYKESIFDQFINEKIMHENLKQQQEILPGAKMLAPLTGGSLVVSQYPEFFSHIASEMEILTKTERYLVERVRMENESLMLASHLEYPLGCTYAEIALFAGKKPYFSELLYILSETFPTKFPRLVFTTALMYSVLP